MHLRENKAPDTSKWDLGRSKAFAVYFAVLVVVGVIAYLISHNSAP